MIDVLVVGGGISGLSFLHFLKEYHPNLTSLLIEEKESLGGWIQPIQLPSGQWYDSGPRTLRLRGESAFPINDLFDSLNLSQKVMKASKESSSRFVILNKKPCLLPKGPHHLLSTPIGRKLLLATLLEPFRHASPLDDETVHSFFYRRAPYKLVSSLTDALVTGIWGGDPHELSIMHTFPELKNLEKTYGSCLLGGILSLSKKQKKAKIRGIVSLKNGLSSLIQALQKELHPYIETKRALVRIEETKECVIAHTTTSPIKTKCLVLAIPEKRILSFHVPSLWKHQSPLPHTSIASVSVGFKEDLLKNKGFGILTPSSEDPSALGIIFDSSLFHDEESPMKTRLTVLLGGRRAPHLVQESEETLLHLSLDRIQKWTGISQKPHEHIILKSPDCIPQPTVGAYPLSPYFSNDSKKIFAIGASIGGAAVSSCIANSQKLALDIIKC